MLSWKRKKETRTSISYLEHEMQNLKEQNHKLSSENRKLLHIFNQLVNLTKDNQNIRLMGIDYEKGNLSFTYLHRNAIYVCEAFESHPATALFFDIIENGKEKCLFIQDIQSRVIGKGYGKVAMKHLFTIANENRINLIVGKEYYTDTENRNRQHKFYSSLGFTKNGSRWEKRL